MPALAGGGAEGRQAESRIVDIVAARHKISRAEAQGQVTRTKQQFAQTKNEAIATARSAAGAAAGTAAGTSFILVLALLVGAAASDFGAIAATRRRLR